MVGRWLMVVVGGQRGLWCIAVVQGYIQVADMVHGYAADYTSLL